MCVINPICCPVSYFILYIFLYCSFMYFIFQLYFATNHAYQYVIQTTIEVNCNERCKTKYPSLLLSFSELSVSFALSIISVFCVCESAVLIFPQAINALINKNIPILLFIIKHLIFSFCNSPMLVVRLGHLSDTIIQPETVSPILHTCFQHYLSGHFIFRIITISSPPKV